MHSGWTFAIYVPCTLPPCPRGRVLTCPQLHVRALCPLEALVCGAIDHARSRLRNARASESMTMSLSTTARQAATATLHNAVGDDLDFLFQAVVQYAHPFRVGGGGVSSACGPSEGYSMDAGITRAVVEALVDAGNDSDVSRGPLQECVKMYR